MRIFGGPNLFKLKKTLQKKKKKKSITFHRANGTSAEIKMFNRDYYLRKKGFMDETMLISHIMHEQTFSLPLTNRSSKSEGLIKTFGICSRESLTVGIDTFYFMLW